MKKFTIRFFAFLFTFYILHSTFTLPTIAAPIDIGERYGFGGVKTLGEGLGTLVRPGFALAAALVVLYFVFAGFKYITSGGNKEEIASAQKMIQYAIIGFVILMTAFLVLQFLLVRLFNLTDLQIIQF